MDDAVLAIPDDLAAALAAHPHAARAFDELPPSHQREHIRAINDARRPETRARRIAKTLEKLAR